MKKFNCTWTRFTRYGVATISRLLKIIGLFCKWALEKRLYSAKDTCKFEEPTNRSHPIPQGNRNPRHVCCVPRVSYIMIYQWRKLYLVEVTRYSEVIKYSYMCSYVCEVMNYIHTCESWLKNRDAWVTCIVAGTGSAVPCIVASRCSALLRSSFRSCRTCVMCCSVLQCGCSVLQRVAWDVPAEVGLDFEVAAPVECVAVCCRVLQ